MSPLLTSQVVALATTAAMAVSGTMILLALRLHQKTLPGKSWFRPSNSSSSSGSEEVHGSSSLPDVETRSMGEKQSSCSTKKRKKNKRVRFADSIVDPAGYNDEFKRHHAIIVSKTNKNSHSRPSSSSAATTTTSADRINRGMPENRMALYSGILKDRLIQRLAYSY